MVFTCRFEPRADGFVGEGSDEGLPMTTFFTRRTALGVAVAGALSALTACASDIRPLAGSTGSASPSEAATTSDLRLHRRLLLLRRLRVLLLLRVFRRRVSPIRVR